MGLRTQKQVLAELDGMSGRQMNRAADDYVREIVEPLVEELKSSQSSGGALDGLGARMLRRMKSGGLERAVADASVQSAMIGRVSALPKGPRDEGT